MTGKLTIITSESPAHLGKTFRLTAKGLNKRTAGQMVSGSFEVAEFGNVSDLTRILAGVTTSQAITASLPRDGSRSGRLVTNDEKPNHPGALARSKDDFGLLPCGGVMILDYDPPGEALSRDALWQTLCKVMPCVEQAGVFWWCSGSSFIYQGDEVIQGLRGQRIYVMVQDASDIERAGKVLEKRLWLAGCGRIEISTAGSLLLRSLVDSAMFQPARLDFIGGAVCEPPLEQRRGEPLILGSGGFLDTVSALPDLTLAEQAQFEGLVEKAKAEAVPEAERVRAAWKEARKPAMVDKLERQGVPVVEAEQRATQALNSALDGAVLLGDFLIELADGKSVTVGEILDNRGKYHGQLTRDPLEPEYRGRKVCGKLYLYGATPILTSRAHGGARYRLMRQPARLYVQKGNRASLVDQIIDRMSGEPDLFLMGGRLVQLVDGEARPLRRHALLHTVQSRVAFFSKNPKGEDMPVDLPAEVVDMLMAVLENQS